MQGICRPYDCRTVAPVSGKDLGLGPVSVWIGPGRMPRKLNLALSMFWPLELVAKDFLFSPHLPIHLRSYHLPSFFCPYNLRKAPLGRLPLTDFYTWDIACSR